MPCHSTALKPLTHDPSWRPSWRPVKTGVKPLTHDPSRRAVCQGLYTCPRLNCIELNYLIHFTTARTAYKALKRDETENCDRRRRIIGNFSSVFLKAGLRIDYADRRSSFYSLCPASVDSPPEDPIFRVGAVHTGISPVSSELLRFLFFLIFLGCALD